MRGSPPEGVVRALGRFSPHGPTIGKQGRDDLVQQTHIAVFTFSSPNLLGGTAFSMESSGVDGQVQKRSPG